MKTALEKVQTGDFIRWCKLKLGKNVPYQRRVIANELRIGTKPINQICP